MDSLLTRPPGVSLWQAIAEKLSTAVATWSNKTLVSPVFTGTPTGITKAHVGLGSADNTADSAKTVASAAALTTSRKVDGVAFNGSADIRTLAANPGSPLAYTSGQYFFCSSAAASGTSALLGNGAARVTRWDITAPITITRLFAEVATTPGEAGSKFRIGIWNDDGTGKPGTLLLDAGQIAGDSVAVQELTVSQALPAGTYWVGGAVQSAPTTQPTMRIVGTSNVQHHFPLGSSLPAAATVAVGFSHTGQAGAFGAFTPAVGGSAPRIGYRVA